MGSLNYLSLMRFIAAVVGNSSSGIIEAPFFKVATINIGSRQDGRTRSKSTIECSGTESSIRKAFKKIYERNFRMNLKKVNNPYYKKGSVNKITKVLENFSLNNIIQKKFYNILNEKTFIIAEAGVNHNGNLKTAKKLIDAAKEAGADAIKFQSYITENLVTKNQIKQSIKNHLVKETQFQMLKNLNYQK